MDIVAKKCLSPNFHIFNVWPITNLSSSFRFFEMIISYTFSCNILHFLRIFFRNCIISKFQTFKLKLSIIEMQTEVSCYTDVLFNLKSEMLHALSKDELSWEWKGSLPCWNMVVDNSRMIFISILILSNTAGTFFHSWGW